MAELRRRAFLALAFVPLLGGTAHAHHRAGHKPAKPSVVVVPPVLTLTLREV